MALLTDVAGATPNPSDRFALAVLHIYRMVEISSDGRRVKTSGPEGARPAEWDRFGPAGMEYRRTCPQWP